MTEPSHSAALCQSYDTVAAEYAKRVRPPAELDPLSRSMLAFGVEIRKAGAHGFGIAERGD